MNKPRDSWSTQDAKAKFSALIDAALKDGPQTVTRRGEAAAVVVPAQLWRRIQSRSRPSLKEVLLDHAPRIEHDWLPERPKGRAAPKLG